jgi:CheY-like chemotaxis protein
MVENNEFIVEMHKLKFQDAGHEFFAFYEANGDFVEKVANLHPDLISLGVLMPGVDGFEAITLLKKDDRTKDIPVIFLTNLGQKEDVERGFSLGAEDYRITAETTPDQLVDIYSKFLSTTLSL